MTLIRPSSLKVSCPEVTAFEEGRAGRTVIWLRGEHDTSTAMALVELMTRVIALDHADVVLDLSDVQFMDSTTVRIIIRARKFLQQRSRRLSVRSPSTFARRVLAICGLEELIDHRLGVELARAGGADALSTWVAVPATDRSSLHREASARKLSGTSDPVPAGPSLRREADAIRGSPQPG